MSTIHDYTSIGRLPTHKSMNYFDPYLHNRRIINFDMGITDLANWRDRIDEFTAPINRTGVFSAK